MWDCDTVLVSGAEWWRGIREGCAVSVEACDRKRRASEEEGKLVESNLGGLDIKALSGRTIAVKARRGLKIGAIRSMLNEG